MLHLPDVPRRAVAFTLLSIIALLSQSLADVSAQTTAPAIDSVAADDIRKEGATYFDESFDAYEAIRKLNLLVEAADWPAATDAAQLLIDRFGSKVCREDPTRLITIRRRIFRLISAWPEEGLAAYIRRANPLAESQLDEARQSADPDALLRVADAFFPTPAAADALELACAMFLEAGDFDSARQWLTCLIDEHPLRNKRRESWTTMRAIAAAWAGDPAPLKSLTVSAAPATWAGRELNTADLIRSTLADTASRGRSTPGSNAAFYVSEARQNLRPASVRAEAVIWTFSRFEHHTLADAQSSENPNVDAPAPQTRALAGGRLLAMQPVAAAGRVIVHDHRSVWAIDPAQTDRPAWRFDLIEAKDDGQPWTSEDEPPPIFTTTIAGGRVYAPLERKPPDRYGADPANPGASVLVCLDLDSGKPIWTADLVNWRSEFEEARIDGAPIIVRDRVLAIARRRKAFGFEACYLIGFDRADGRIAFATHLGEAAIGGFGYRRATITHPAAAGDLVFVQTNLGTIAAVSAGAGALQWLYQYAPAAADSANPPGPGRSGQPARSWQNSPAMVWHDRVIAAPLDSTDLLLLDQSTGSLVKSIPMPELLNPECLIGIADDRLFLAGSSVTCYDLNAQRVAWERQIPDGELHGAPAISSEGLFIPTTLALLRFPLDGGTPQSHTWELADAGNAIVAPAAMLSRAARPATTSAPQDWPDQIVIAAPARIYALARKEDAFARMESALASRPEDPAIALALADLCLRTGEFRRGNAALDAALQRAGGLTRITDAALRRRLFEAHLAFADAIAADTRSERTTSQSEAGDLAIPLLRRAGQISLEPPDQVAFRIRLARALDADGKPDAAAALWQQILSDPSLAGVTATPELVGNRRDPAADPEDPPRAGDLARAAIDHLIAEHGQKVYAAIEADAEQRLAAAYKAGDTAALLRVADAFPNGSVAPRALLRRAELFTAQGQHDRAAAAARRALGFGIAVDRPKTMIELARTLKAAGRPHEAADWLTRVEREFPEYEIASDDRRVPLAEFRSTLLADWRQRPLRPDPGRAFKIAYRRELSESPTILVPRFPDLANTDYDAVFSYTDNAIDCRTARDDAPRWPEPAPCRIPPTLLGLDARNAVFATRYQVLAIDRATGSLNWKLGDYPADADAPGVDPESIAAWSLHAMTDRRLYSANDRGELFAADLADGSVTWRVPTTQRAAAELVAADDVVAYVARQARSSLVVLRDAADGNERASIQVPDDRAVQSLALSPPGLLLVLTARELFAYQTADAKLRWRAPLKSRSLPASFHCDASIACILGDDGRITALDLDDGRIAWTGEPLPSPPATPPWTDVANGVLFSAARSALAAFDDTDGRRLWSAPESNLPLDPSSLQTPQLLRSSIMIVTPHRRPSSDADPPPRRRGRRADARLTVDLYQFSPVSRSELPPPISIDLGVLAQFRGVYAFNGAIIVVDGRTIIGYAPGTQAPQTSQP